MKKLAILLSGLALAALPCSSALASDLTFSFAGTDFSANGDFTYVPTATANQYLITAFAGTADILGTAETITGVAPINGFAGNDNIVYIPPTFGLFDFNGAAFFTTGDYAVNLFTDGGTPFELLGVASNGQFLVTDSVPVNVTPEPGSLALLGTGALGVVGVLRRKLIA